MSNDTEDKWQPDSIDLPADFGRRCAELKDSNPFDLNALDLIINNLMTELWDNCFSQTEIRNAFQGALADMPRYATGNERRR